MEIVVGDVVTGENLHGRERDLDVLWDRIRSNSVLLSSPRRFGKTSLVREMQRNPRNGMKMVYMDMEGAGSADEFVLKLAGKIDRPYRQRILERLAGAGKSVEEIGVYGFTARLRESSWSWQEKGSKLLEAIKDQIIVLDELPMFLLTLERKNLDIGGFMAWLREIRQEHGVRFILCGSVGIDGVLDRHGLGNSINDLERITVRPFDAETALSMVEKILDGYGIAHSDNQAKDIVDRIGAGVPYFLQLVLRQIINETDYGRMELTGDTAEKAYEEAVWGKEGRKYFVWYRDRLGAEFPSDSCRRAAEYILDSVAAGRCEERDLKTAFRNEAQYDEPVEFSRIINKLQDGFYITGGPTYAFATKILRDWWARERDLDAGL